MMRIRWMTLLTALTGLFIAAGALAQTGMPVIRSFSVDQVAQLSPGTELVFRASGTRGGSLSLSVDGVAEPMGLVETRPGTYEGAYTISIRDKLAYDSKVQATLKVGARQTTALLGQPLLTEQAYAQAVAAAHPNPRISRFETRNSGAFTGGHELSFLLDGTAGGAASVSLDGGHTSIALSEETSGHYSGAYTVKTRDRFSQATQVSATLAIGERSASVVKSLAAGALVPTAPAPMAVAPAAGACDGCGVVVSVTLVKVKGKPNYVGAIAGGVLGGALGNQIGGGSGKAAATVLGAVGGAVAGREIEKRARSDERYDVLVRLDNGTNKTVSFEADPGFKAGRKVRLSGDTLVAND